MAAVPPPPARRRPRPGSLERPVNAKLYRGTWLLVGLPLLIAAFSVARPQPLPPPEQLSALEGAAIKSLADAEFAAHSPERHGVVAVINLDAIGSSSRPRLQIGGDTPRTTSGTLLETAAARIAKQAGRGPSRPSVLRQLIDLGFPFSPYE